MYTIEKFFSFTSKPWALYHVQLYKSNQIFGEGEYFILMSMSAKAKFMTVFIPENKDELIPGAPSYTDLVDFKHKTTTGLFEENSGGFQFPSTEYNISFMCLANYNGSGEFDLTTFKLKLELEETTSMQASIAFHRQELDKLFAPDP